MKRKNVLIYGWFGHENIGDELILKSIIENIKSINSNIKINVMGSKPKSIEKYHNDIECVSTSVDLNLKSIIRTFKYNPIKVIKNLISNDYLIIGSGGALSDWNPSSTVTLFFMIKFFKKILKRPVIMLGAGAGPIIREESKLKFKKVLSNVDYICLRDRESYELLKSIGLKNIYLTNDVVYDLRDDELFKVEKKLITCKNNVGIVIAPLLLNSNKKKEDYKNEIVKYIKGLKKNNVEFKLIPFQYRYDIEFLRSIQNEVEVDIYEGGSHNMWSILDELKKYDLIVGMRFHSVVISILLNIPVIPIIYHSKVNSCAKQFNLLSLAQSVGDGENWEDSNISSEKMLSDTLIILDNIKEEKEKLKNILDESVKKENKRILNEFLKLGE